MVTVFPPRFWEGCSTIGAVKLSRLTRLNPSLKTSRTCFPRHYAAFLKMSAFREDVSKLREAAVQQADMRQAVRDRDETIKGEGVREPPHLTCYVSRG